MAAEAPPTADAPGVGADRRRGGFFAGVGATLTGASGGHAGGALAVGAPAAASAPAPAPKPHFNQHDADARRMDRRARLEADIMREDRAPLVDGGTDVLADGDLFSEEDKAARKDRKPKKSPPSDFKRWAECNVLDSAARK